jgi:hypothetical protein
VSEQTTSNVVSLSGEEIPSGQPVEAVVERVKWVLEAAEAGQINGIAVVLHWPDGATGAFMAGVTSYSMAGRLSLLLNETIDAMKKS